MATPVQDYANPSVNGASTITSSSLTFTAGNTLVVISTKGSGATWTPSDSNGGNTWVTGATSGTGSNDLTVGYASNIVGGTYTVSVNSSGNIGWMYLIEWNGLSAYINSIGNRQVSPGTATDAITSGAITISQNALLMGLCLDNGGSTYPAAGTGFTSQNTVWATSSAPARVEYKTTASTAAATWTTSNSFDTFPSVAIAFSLASAVPLMGQICL